MSITEDLLNHLFKNEPLLKKVNKLLDFLFDLLIVLTYHKIFKSFVVFKFQGESYQYFLSPYNFTWEHERIIEIPIILKLVRDNQGKKILEVGNVLSHYTSFNHDIVDKYEKGENVINVDIVDFHPNHKYDLIVSISTFEHIGFDESPKDPTKVLDAFRNVENMLAPGGKAIITLPLGYNPELDKLLNDSKLPFVGRYYMKRVSRLNSWVEVNRDTVSNSNPKFDKPYHLANWLLVAVISNHSVEKTD